MCVSNESCGAYVYVTIGKSFKIIWHKRYGVNGHKKQSTQLFFVLQIMIIYFFCFSLTKKKQGLKMFNLSILFSQKNNHCWDTIILCLYYWHRSKNIEDIRECQSEEKMTGSKAYIRVLGLRKILLLLNHIEGRSKKKKKKREIIPGKHSLKSHGFVPL